MYSESEFQLAVSAKVAQALKDFKAEAEKEAANVKEEVRRGEERSDDFDDENRGRLDFCTRSVSLSNCRNMTHHQPNPFRDSLRSSQMERKISEAKEEMEKEMTKQMEEVIDHEEKEFEVRLETPSLDTKSA